MTLETMVTKIYFCLVKYKVVYNLISNEKNLILDQQDMTHLRVEYETPATSELSTLDTAGHLNLQSVA